MRRLHCTLPTAISRSVCTARGSNKDVSTGFRKHRLTGCTDLLRESGRTTWAQSADFQE
jgi:hypothetical protein